MEQNKKKIFFLTLGLILVLSLAFAFSGCVPPVPEVIDVTGVEITEEDQSIKVDETLQLTAVVTPENATNKAITWESDNTDVATVDEDGMVTALKSGIANITVTTEDGGFSDTIKITITKLTPVPSPTPLIKTYEVSFGVYLIPELIPAGLTSSRGEDPEPNLAGVEIEIFTDEARTDKVTTVTTDENGMATIKLPNGTYYFIANRERYICAPMDEIIDENYEVITLPTPIATLTVQGSFTISDEDISDTILIIARDTYIVNFLATENNTQTYGVSRVTDPVPSPTPLEGVTIEIYKGGFRNTSILERTAKQPVEEFKITTLTTNSDGMVQVYLHNGPYNFTASKEGYADYPPENISFSVQRVVQKDYFEVIGADIIEPPVLVPMKRVYTLTVNTDPTNSGTASDVTNSGPYTAGTVVTISAEAADGYEFDSWTAAGCTFADDTSTNTTFTMPAEDTTVTANFTPIYTVTIADVGGAATVVANPNTDIPEGETITVTISDIVSGKTFSSIQVTGDNTNDTITTTKVTEGAEYTFLMPAEDVTVTANFSEPLYTLTMNVDPTGAGTANDITGSGTYTAGTEVKISAEAADGYGFFNWTSSAVEDLFSDFIHMFSSTSFTMPAEDVTVKANFKKALFAEDFTDATIGEIPTEWSSEYNNWYIRDSSDASGNKPEMLFEMLHDDDPDSTGTYKLISPSFNSNEFSKIILIFKYSTRYFKDTEPYTLKVEYTTDGGTTWKGIWSTTTIYDWEIFQETIDLSASNSDIQIAWVFDGNPYYISYWAIDDILLLGDE